MSRKFLLCTAATAALLTSPVLAADLPVKARPAPLPLAWSWAGFYIGGHGGYGWKENDYAEVIQANPVLTLGGIDSRGWVAGGQAGYNWQYGRWVAGLEVDGSATQIRGTSAALVRTFAGGISITDTAGDDVKYLGTARARVGGAIPFANTNVLLYGTGGLAWERVNRIDNTLLVVPGTTQFASTVTPRDHFGWAAGVGGEFRLGASNWIGRIEYLHYDFGTVERTTSLVTIPAIPGGTFADKGGRQTIDVVRAGLSYKFDAPASPLSAYAADMPVKARPVSPLAWSWAGFYLGGHGGYGWKSNDFADLVSVIPLLTVGGIDSRGWVAGGQAGYNWQYGRWVAGFELDGSATGIRGDSVPLVRTFAGGISVTDTRSDDVKYLGTARTRVGGAIPFANTDVLLYGTAGLAWERVNRINSTSTIVPGTTQFAATTTPRDHFGWVAGVGGEVRLGASNWIGRIEYLHYDFGTVEATTAVVTTPATPGGTFADKGGRQTIDVVRAGLSYKFEGGASPLSAYAAVPAGGGLPPALWSWAGFYIGGHGGYGWKQNDFAEVISVVPPLSIGGIDSRGWVAGGQAGYNWQFGSWVAGLEMDGSATRIRGTSAPVVQSFAGPITITETESDDVKYLGTIRARLGGAIPNTGVLLYGTAGLAWERLNRTDTTVLVVPGTTQSSIGVTPRDHFGWVAGAGGEFRLGASNWIGRVEYLHYDFGTVESATTVVTTPVTLGGTFADRAGRQTIDVVRGGLSYKFAATP